MPLKIEKMSGWVTKRVRLWLGRLPLESADIESINKQNIRSADAFWKKMSADPQLIDHLTPSDEPAKIRIINGMTEVADYQSKRLTRTRLKNHVPDALIMAAIIAALYGMLHDRPPRMIVANPEGIMPFHIITASDLRIEAGAKNASRAMSINDFVGRYATNYIAAGTAIDGSKLSRGRKLTAEETGTVFRAKIQPTSIMNGLEAPFDISLLACSRPKGPEPCTLIPEIKVLEFQTQADGISIVIACKREDGGKLAALMGSSDLMVTGSAH